MVFRAGESRRNDRIKELEKGTEGNHVPFVKAKRKPMLLV